MNWGDVKDAVAKYAPLAGAALGGPSGAAVGSILASVLGVEATPEAVQRAIQTDPEAAIKLRQVEAQVEESLIDARGKVITAEAQGESWLQRNWRPLLMIWFGALVGAHWLGFTPDNLDVGTVGRLLDIVQLGIGGYVFGRSAEKITRTVSGTGLLDRVRGH
ncbi:holin (3TMs family) [Modicisalibacter xianhensis]|uniref:Holin (3TMs family) n=1 Tax=Modicisalibacter xianhensis TaxID=442341 RepID=A0A4R8FXX8_9GAMM|nr:3TM-type holin [Halomonas xianhensis]TDX29113.1 holin (3TMs family) [Halomonas xianhensis]